eukprot:809_1
MIIHCSWSSSIAISFAMTSHARFSLKRKLETCSKDITVTMILIANGVMLLSGCNVFGILITLATKVLVLCRDCDCSSREVDAMNAMEQHIQLINGMTIIFTKSNPDATKGNSPLPLFVKIVRMMVEKVKDVALNAYALSSRIGVRIPVYCN